MNLSQEILAFLNSVIPFIAFAQTGTFYHLLVSKPLWPQVF